MYLKTRCSQKPFSVSGAGREVCIHDTGSLCMQVSCSVNIVNTFNASGNEEVFNTLFVCFRDLRDKTGNI